MTTVPVHVALALAFSCVILIVLMLWSIRIMDQKDRRLAEQDAKIAMLVQLAMVGEPTIRANMLAKWVLSALAALKADIAITPESPAHKGLREIVEDPDASWLQPIAKAERRDGSKKD